MIISKIYFTSKLKFISVHMGPLVQKEVRLNDELEQIYQILN